MPNSATTGSMNSRKPLLTMYTRPGNCSKKPRLRRMLSDTLPLSRSTSSAICARRAGSSASRCRSDSENFSSPLMPRSVRARIWPTIVSRSGGAFEGNVGQLVEAFHLRKRAVEINDEVGEWCGVVGHSGSKVGRGGQWATSTQCRFLRFPTCRGSIQPS